MNGTETGELTASTSLRADQPSDASRKRARTDGEDETLHDDILARFAQYEEEKSAMRSMIDSLAFRLQSIEARLTHSLSVSP